ncbi:A disintegrin and metalloproteinase with thrombospondin motifs 3-like protein [Lates japonicus]|uniref:A disintegrin and metalloproteinase with thrombospondin motifs 3-like protein n=1 Tax=Lates japonicus TaxID=270547 RepID=A0AAD3NCY6_LATJO|nr:A disintegrin and metalloproteinase with thrombospondin motifs 3-like protein [Lates japonicus]
MIRTDSDEYFIEPLERDTQELEDQGRVHVVYRRSALLQAPSDISVDYQLQGNEGSVGHDQKQVCTWYNIA